MYFPAFYLEKITCLVNQGNFLYHWTTVANSKEIIKDKFIYSKATLFGLDPQKNIPILRQYPDLRTDTENGFIDYVFLGNTNWIAVGHKSYYGQVGFEINPVDLLNKTEFFVFPFNTGRYYQTTSKEFKFSDLTTLKEALGKKTKNYEVLVKGKIEITGNTINRIICDDSNIEDLRRALSNNKLNSIPIEEY
ncbi:hypothetical protein ACJEHO_08820 [Legionella pneumophila]|uniref:hypothetical protein n=1 Tax=Legionella pneumophila TaxID=446 RepID=UPI0038B5CBC9